MSHHLIQKERDELYRKLIEKPERDFNTKICLSLLAVTVFPLIIACMCSQKNKAKENADEAFKTAVRKPPKGSWRKFKNMNLLNKGGVMLVNHWRHAVTTIGIGEPFTLDHQRFNKDPLDELKLICEENNCTAITVYPGWDHAIGRKLDLNREENKPVPVPEKKFGGYECDTYLYITPGEVAKEKAEIARAEAEKREKFMKTTQADEEAAKYYLEGVKYDFQKAVKNYYNGPDETKVRKFIEATQVDRITACVHLQGAGNDLQSALKNFFSGAPAAPNHMQKRQASPTPSMLSININIDNKNTLTVTR